MNPLLIDVPDTVTTARLTLRTPRAGDGELILPQVRASLPELKQWMPWATDTYALSDAEEWFRKCAAEFIRREQLQYLMLTHDGQHLGNIGAFKFDWKVPRAEIGYWLRTDYTGRGYITEAVRGLSGMLYDLLKFARIEIRTDDRNARSYRVAERAGFTLEGVLRCDSIDAAGVLRDTRIYARIQPRAS